MFSPYFGQQFLHDLRLSCNQLLSVLTSAPHVKSDQTLVTQIDKEISHFCKRHPSANGFLFYSEEEHSDLKFPALVVDPIDGTRELVALRAECAVSVAWMPSPKLSEGYGLIFNPFTGFTISSDDRQCWKDIPNTESLLGLVSRSEWESGLFESSTLNLQPRGSIAFKLGLLSAGACDYVVSKKPKNIWDIAAGTILAHQRGYEFWSAGKKITQLETEVYAAPLLWAKTEVATSLLAQL